MNCCHVVKNVTMEKTNDIVVSIPHSKEQSSPQTWISYAQGASTTELHACLPNHVIRKIAYSERILSLLVSAFNNRTRERNYFKAYSELLSGECSEEQFEHEIESNEDDYVVPAGQKMSDIDIKLAMTLVSKLKGVETMDDFMSMFSIDSESIEKCLSIDNGGTL